MECYNLWKCAKKSEISTTYKPFLAYNLWKCGKKSEISTDYDL